MSKRDNNKKDTSEEKSRLHTPQAAQTTTPVNLKSGDKLRENPANDEETIEQDPRKTSGAPKGQSPLSREHDGGRNQITNEDDQKDIVNPTGGDWDEPQEEPSPTKNPEEIDDDPEGTRRKIPKM